MLSLGAMLYLSEWLRLVHSALFSGCVDPADVEQAVVFWSQLGTRVAVEVVPPNLVVVLGGRSLEKCPCAVWWLGGSRREDRR